MKGASQGALWLFNLRFGLAALLAIVVAVAFAAGLSAIVGALDFLFGVSVSNTYEHIWATAIFTDGPLYGLSLMPTDIDEEVDIEAQKGTLLERGVSVLVNYVLVPVIAVYALMLHAYAVKIVLEQALPKGNVATMVSVFAVGGTGAWLIAWPWREKGTLLLRLFMRGWFWFTIVPAILLVIAIWRRVADYGVTPDRYGIAIIAVWIAAVTALSRLAPQPRRHADDPRRHGGAAAGGLRRTVRRQWPDHHHAARALRTAAYRQRPAERWQGRFTRGQVEQRSRRRRLFHSRRLAGCRRASTACARGLKAPPKITVQARQ